MLRGVFMPSHMSVQTIATKRNAFAEMLVDYILQRFAEDLYQDGLITAPAVPARQKPFSREDCSEVYDHYLELHLSPQLDPSGRTLELWAQTTCYKGNRTGKPESNKTYEIRETLVEALTLRKWLVNEARFFRTIHFTLGPSDYTYGWFMSAKQNAFDLSLYPKFDSSEDLFEVISVIGKGTVYEFDFYEKLDSIMENEQHPLSRFIFNTVSTLKSYLRSGFAPSSMADMQAVLLREIQVSSTDIADSCIASSINSGMDIKGKSVKMLEGSDIVDPILGNTLKRLFLTNPFLSVALDAINNWPQWFLRVFSRERSGPSLYEYVYALWADPTPDRYVIRRLLMRIYTDGGIHYIQDIDIEGLDEHNLYNGIHTRSQIEEMTEYLLSKYRDHGILNARQLYERLTSPFAKMLVSSSLKFERINGSSLKPSFFYLEEYLKPTYRLVSFEEAGLPAPVAYHARFAEGLKVKPYDNLKVIQDTEHMKNLAVVKGKFFRRQEFPRRAKEEAYVGITAQYDLLNGQFTKKYPDLPFVMFIDMAEGYTPPEFALRRLVNYGWIPFFQLDKLKLFLKELEEK